MTIIKRAAITMPDGSAAVLSTAEIAPGEYETMLASPDFSEEYRVIRSNTESEAMKAHAMTMAEYHTTPLSGKYLKLAEDLARSARSAEVISRIVEDGGACNFDSCAIHLKGWRRKKVEQAARAAGVGCFLWGFAGGGCYVFPLRISAQGDARTAAAEAMRDHMRASGYDCGVYYQMD